MARRDRELREDVEAYLRSAGATITESSKTRGGHPVVRWTLRGTARVTFFPGTASDHRSRDNTLALVRRQVRAIEEGR